MKFLSTLICISFLLTGCKKSGTCQSAEITKMFPGTPCEKWAIKVQDTIYSAPNLPVEYEQNGLMVCVTYTLYNDPKMCACCGGITADITSIQKR